MALHGDFSSFALPELLQWLDTSRKTGTLVVQGEDVERRFFLHNGHAIATSTHGLWERIARMLELANVVSGEDAIAAFTAFKTTGDLQAFEERRIDLQHLLTFSAEEIFGAVADLTVSGHGKFHWSEDTEKWGEEWAPLEQGLRAVVFEALRWVDEGVEVARALPSDAVVVASRAPANASHALIFRAILAFCQSPRSLGEVCFTIGLPRTTTLRRVFDLVRLGLVVVEGGGAVGKDPLSDLLEKGQELVRAREFDAAGMLFASLLQSDPNDRRVRDLVRLAESEHVAALYQTLTPIRVFELSQDVSAVGDLRAEDRQVANLINGSWDVSTIALANPARELETLKSLQRLVHLGLVRPVA